MNRTSGRPNGSGRGRLWLAVASCAVVAGVCALVAPGAANACDATYHCWAEVNWDTDFYTGGLAYITTTRLTASNPSDTFSTSEMWVCDPYTYGECWTFVETGLTVGKRHNADVAGTGMSWFWAEDPMQGDTCSIYQEHYSGMPSSSLGTTYAAKISYNNGWKWGIYRDGTFLANSSPCHYNESGSMRAGAEITGDSNQVTATASDLQKRHANGQTWSYNWGGAVLNRDPSDASNPLTISWLTQYASARYTGN